MNNENNTTNPTNEAPRTVHTIAAKYHGQKGSKGARVGLRSFRFERDRVEIPYNSANGCKDDQAEKWLRAHGFTVLTISEAPENVLLFGVAEFCPLQTANREGLTMRAKKEAEKNASK